MIPEKKQTSKWRGRVFRYVPFLLCVLLIFFLSSSEGSMARTSLFVRPLLKFLFPGAGEETLLLYHGYVRKLAHLTEYALLAITAARAFRTSSKRFLGSFWALSALFAVITVAAVDESYQSFNPERTGTISDVIIDIAGGLLGLAGIWLFTSIWTRANSIRSY